ncbi:putative NBD/HSP70 family sugar kinase [Homoserinimonas aerilata]|uniref:Putative NBD/HSP70 family sugar kinase n=1 Tax=Homoserinimonas aerilata TaxID=1162970 RepID=A0A542YFZ6_9MICO|nr:ROK family protein [Homoserinimonas aerilata]TQL46999.1 putative NBD/HSP70 family sugar kinase [Homoserinimonas aerilata]
MTGSTAAVPADARLGVDIGGTKTEAVLLDGGGTIVRQIRIPTGFGPDGVVASTLDAISRLEAPGVPIGIGTPGTVDPVAGTVSHALNLGVERLELGQRVADAVGYGVRVENDVNAAALGAFHLLGRPGTDSIGYLNLGTGLAAGLVLDGRLWRGSRGAAGEIGHILVDPKGPLDLDGQPGGLEVMASGSGIARQWGTGEPNAVSAVLDAADAGDRRAVDIRRRLFDGIASAVRILVLTVDVDAVVVGGGISRLGERIVDGVGEVFDGWAASSPFIASLELRERMMLLPGDAPVAALGAAWIGEPAARDLPRSAVPRDDEEHFGATQRPDAEAGVNG